tara:strand:- start:8147 stop:8833 length:687 start_codon:yes stop_codon:yes gene_type:complete
MTCERKLERGATFTEIHRTLVENDAISESEAILVVDGHRQKIYLMESGRVSASYECSTGASGFGNEEGSDKTSTGMMYVSRKIGNGEPVGRVFQYKSPTQYILPEDSGEYAWVCTRVLVLSGHQRRNKNVYQRAIYIHGTNRRSMLGTPASGGCIRMSNVGSINLFDRISVGTKVFVAASDPEDNPTLPCEDTDRSLLQVAKDKYAQTFRTPDAFKGEDLLGGEPEHD